MHTNEEWSAEIRAAREREQFARSAAFLPVTESIGGFDVLPMTLTHLVLLRVARSPLLSGGRFPSPEDLAAFLWILSPEFTTAPGPARACFLKRCREEFMPVRKPWLRTSLAMVIWERKEADRLARAAGLINAARAYVDEAFMDAAPPDDKSSARKEYFESAIGICAMFGREFGWSEETTMRMPLKRILQYRKEIERDRGSKTLCNPSDSVVAKWQREQEEKAKARNAA